MSRNPGPGYGQPFPPHDGGASDGPERMPATLGIIGLVLVVISLLVIIVLNLGPSVYVVSGWSTSDSAGQLSAGWLSAGDVLIPLAIGLVGLTGWIIGIVATATNRGRSFGIAAIVVGTLIAVIAAPMMFGVLWLKSMG